MLPIPFGVFVASSILIMVVFGAAAGSTGTSRTPDYARTNRFRLLFLASLTVVLLTFLALTLPRLPYATEARAPDRIVHAVGKQHAWSLTDGTGPSLETWDRDFSPTATGAAATPVGFRVSPLDVNDGFSLYAPDGHLVAQTQAMPGYMNRLRITLDQAGTYTVLCLEFFVCIH